MSNRERSYHRRGEQTGAGAPLSVLPIHTKGEDGQAIEGQLLDAGEDSTELDLLRTVASRLGVRWGHDEFGWWAVIAGRGFPTWAVWRQDDSGNSYLMKANLTEESAKAMVAEFEARGHKQFYWSSDETLA